MKKYLEPTATESLVRVLVPVFGVSIFVFWKSKRNLLLKDTRYPSNEINYKNCKKAAVIHGWGTASDIEMVRLEFETAASLGSWGELITILFTSSGIYINSRPLPTKRPSIVALGKTN
ncbi:hypothetical protein ND922_02600 [Vibrio diabolicus]|uniref:hypothetical protein n=1 Tax=Vibrio diabolicus TaxID=50719 RepID=UPI00215FE874|nr:hypothetical protein [Vibrio diabolicus]MCS0367915.1 hypothetical protein [Vibrio diabolicus]